MTTSTTPFVKSITASYEVTGRRKRLVGFVGALRDESGTVLSAQLYDTKPDAEQALDALAHELLLDAAERGLVDTVLAQVESAPTCQCRNCIQPATHNVDGTLACCFHYSEELTGILCGCTDDDYADAAWESDHGSYNGKVPSGFTQPEPSTVNWNSMTDRATAERLAEALARTIQMPTYVIEQDGRYMIQDDADLDCYFANTDPPRIVYVYAPDRHADPPAPEPNPLGDSEGDSTPRACPNCAGAHYGWQCPEVARALFAPEPWADPGLGRELCRMRWRDFPRFVALLRSVQAEGHLDSYAASYQAFIRDYAPDSTLAISQIVQTWTRAMHSDRQVAA